MPLTDDLQGVIAQATRRRHRMDIWLIAVNAAIALLLAALVYVVLQGSHQDFERQIKSVADGLASVAKLDLQGDLERVDAVIRATVSELERSMSAPSEPSDLALNEIVRSRYELVPGAEAVRLTDAAGDVRWGTGLPDGPPRNVADRDYFLAWKEPSRVDTFVAGPLTSRVSGHWVVAFVRPLRVKGKFAGVLYVSIDTDQFRRKFERYNLGPLDSMALRRDDHRLVARHARGSSAQGEPGDTTVSEALAESLATRPQGGSLVSVAAVDGHTRTTSYRALDAWPFVVLAGIENDRFYEPWRRHARTVAALAALAWMLVLVSSGLLRRAARQAADAMQTSADHSARIRALLRTSGDGIHITDGDGHLVEMSDSFADMLNSSRDKLLGRHIASWDVNQDKAAIDAWLAKVKPGDRQRVDVQHRRDDGRVIDVELQLSIAEIGGRRFVFSSARDVTTERRLAREQAAMLNNDLVGMAKIENRLITWRNDATERMLGYAPGELKGQPVHTVYWDESDYNRIGLEGYEALRTAGYYRAQFRMRRKSGEAVWVDFGAVPLSASEVFVMLVDITAMKQAHESLTHAVCHDALTLLPNRILLHDRLRQAQAAARREASSVAVCYLDLDGFKAINDGHGHDAGDHVLKVVASRVLSAIRPLDTAARLGGDEFVVLLAQIHADDWRAILARVISMIAEPITLRSGVAVAVGATAGVTLFASGDGASAEELIERADRMLLHGKRVGKGRIFS